MDSIQLLEATFGHNGERCEVKVTNGDIYVGVYHGYCDSFPAYPLSLRLGISKDEAIRIGIPSSVSEIGVSYDAIMSISFNPSTK